MHNASCCLLHVPPHSSPSNFLLRSGKGYSRNYFLSKLGFFFPQSSPTLSSRTSGAANQPTPMETHPKLYPWSQYNFDMKQVICAALLLLSEVPVTQGQAEAGAKPSHSAGGQL